MFFFHPLDLDSAHTISTWQYESPYDFYNAPADESSAETLLDPQTCLYSITRQTHELVGFCSFGLDAQVPGGNYSEPALDIGLGIRPDLTGQGQGVHYATAVLQFAQTLFQPPTFRVTIAAFNHRAIQVWQKLGFHGQQVFERHPDGTPFVILVLPNVGNNF